MDGWCVGYSKRSVVTSIDDQNSAFIIASTVVFT